MRVPIASTSDVSMVENQLSERRDERRRVAKIVAERRKAICEECQRGWKLRESTHD